MKKTDFFLCLALLAAMPAAAMSPLRTYLVRDLVTTPASTGPGNDNGIGKETGAGNAVTVGDALIFLNARDWFSPPVRIIRADRDGVRELSPDAYVGNLSIIGRIGDAAAFTASDLVASRLYRVDANFSATLVTTLPEQSGEWSLGTLGSTPLVQCGRADAFYSLCTVGPGGAMTVLTSGLPAYRFSPLGEIGGVAILAVDGGPGIWRTDGTAPGTFRLLQAGFVPGNADGRFMSGVLDGRLVFMNCPRQDSCVLTSTDGTVAGTTTLRDLPPTNLVSGRMVRAGSRLVFTLGTGLWSTDGTPAGTDILYGQTASYQLGITAVGGVAHVAFGCASCKFAYAVTDGTPAGTRAIALPPNLEPSGAFVAAVDDDTVVFPCNATGHGLELCVTDAGADEFHLVADIFPGEGHSIPTLLGQAGGGVFFSANDGTHGREVWRVERWTDAIFADGFEPADP